MRVEWIRINSGYYGEGAYECPYCGRVFSEYPGEKCPSDDCPSHDEKEK